MDTAGDDRAGATRARLGLVLVLLLAAFVRADELDDPWPDEGFKSAFGAFAVGAHARGLYQHGFLESGGLPYYWRVELEDGTVARDWYAHHPPFYAWVSAASMRALGEEELALRLPWALASVLVIVPLFRLVALLWGRRAGLFAALLFAVVPYASWWGTLAWCDFVVMALHCVILRRYALWLRGDPGRHVGVIAACFLAGGFVDWTMHFLLPLLGLHAAWCAWRDRGLRAVLPLLTWPGAVLLSLAVHRLHMELVLPPAAASADTGATLAWVTQLPAGQTYGDFLGLQLDYVARYATWPVLALALATLLPCLALALLGRLPRLGWIPLLALPPGLVYVFGFPARSWNHDFFLYVSTPAIALAGGVTLDALARALGSSRAARTALLVAVAGVVVVCEQRRRDLHEAERSDRVPALLAQPALAEVLDDPDAVVVANHGLGSVLPFYSRAPVIQEVHVVDRLEAVRENLLSRLGPGRRVVFLFDVRFNLPVAEVALPLYRYLETEADATTPLVDEANALDLRLFELTEWAGR